MGLNLLPLTPTPWCQVVATPQTLHGWRLRHAWLRDWWSIVDPERWHVLEHLGFPIWQGHDITWSHTMTNHWILVYSCVLLFLWQTYAGMEQYPSWNDRSSTTLVVVKMPMNMPTQTVLFISATCTNNHQHKYRPNSKLCLLLRDLAEMVRSPVSSPEWLWTLSPNVDDWRCSLALIIWCTRCTLRNWDSVPKFNIAARCHLGMLEETWRSPQMMGSSKNPKNHVFNPKVLCFWMINSDLNSG